MSDNEIYYMIVHTRTGGLDYAEMQWFDEDDYNLASKKKFYDEQEAIDYGRVMAYRNGLTWNGELGILDA